VWLFGPSRCQFGNKWLSVANWAHLEGNLPFEVLEARCGNSPRSFWRNFRRLFAWRWQRKATLEHPPTQQRQRSFAVDGAQSKRNPNLLLRLRLPSMQKSQRLPKAKRSREPSFASFSFTNPFRNCFFYAIVCRWFP